MLVVMQPTREVCTNKEERKYDAHTDRSRAPDRHYRRWPSRALCGQEIGRGWGTRGAVQPRYQTRWARRIWHFSHQAQNEGGFAQAVSENFGASAGGLLWQL